MGRVATSEYNLAVCNPEVAKLWHSDKNGDLTPYDFTSGSKAKAWFQCHKKHSWQARIFEVVRSHRNRYRGNGCPACCGRKIVKGNSLADLYPELLDEWDYDKNEILPTEISSKNAKRVSWVCRKCNYGWISKISNRTANGAGCPACNGKVVTKERSLAFCYPELIKDWHTSNDKKPTEVMAGSDYRALWVCHKCSYEWTVACSSRTNPTSPTGCPSCAGNVITSNNCLSALFPQLANEWHPKNKLSPNDVGAGCHEVVLWVCSKCSHEWSAPTTTRVRSVRTNKGGGTGCPACSGRAPVMKIKEARLFNIWRKEEWPYATIGKNQVGEMIQTQLDSLGYNDLNFLSMPAEGREIKQLTKSGFNINYSESLGVEKYNLRGIRELFRKLHVFGFLDGVLPVIKDDIDNVLLDGRELPEFNAVHLDYNGPLTLKHVMATESALKKNPGAIVAVTVQAENSHGLRMDYKQGDFPFISMTPELLFFQPYLGIKSKACKNGRPMETYCFRMRKPSWSMLGQYHGE